MSTRLPAILALLTAGLLLAPSVAIARDDDKPKEEVPEVSKQEAKDALERFDREFDTPDLDLQKEAIERLGKVMHGKVADKLVKLALRHDNDHVRSFAFSALGKQTSSAKKVGPQVARFVAEAAKENAKRKAKGDYGFLMDPRTGDPVTDTPEGQAAMRAKRARSRMIAKAVRVLWDLDYRGKDTIDALEDFLQDGDDELVALCIHLLTRWEVWTSWKPIRALFEMYPDPDKFETGSVRVDTGASGSTDQRAARRKWMAMYGDPDKRRPRPKVTFSIRHYIKELTGEKVEKPSEMRDLEKKPEFRRKING